MTWMSLVVVVMRISEGGGETRTIVKGNFHAPLVFICA